MSHEFWCLSREGERERSPEPLLEKAGPLLKTECDARG